MVNSPAGITTICGQSPQSLNRVRAPGALQMAGGADNRCCGESGSSRGRADATSSAVLAFSSVNCASRSDGSGRATSFPRTWNGTQIMAQTVADNLATDATGATQPRPRN